MTRILLPSFWRPKVLRWCKARRSDLGRRSGFPTPPRPPTWKTPANASSVFAAICARATNSLRADEGSNESLRIRNKVWILPEVVESEIHKTPDAHRQVLAVRVVNEQVSGFRHPVRE